MTSQKLRILEMLRSKEWTCGTEMLGSYISEYRTRINDLRKDGHIIDARPCRQHQHESPNLQEWTLVQEAKVESKDERKAQERREEESRILANPHLLQ